MSENDDLLMKLDKIRKARRKRIIIGSFLVSTSIVLSELAVFIFVGIFEINEIIGLLLLFISLIFLSVGLYLLIHLPPVVVD
ncbi:conserved hypothetical protein [Methanocaldococcus vulcanius M7]|uniref:Uncharacterized protein n=1 Tax=Methanocaldococcus vulcanius (strain ATCC 700851 / DSM 12094 / M7) TaxID=579137 RepID=C9RFD0_METVM|nr:hypothetical protein [Methanocaldococcus vulcanius]ACX72282.1 conserved hypothetical protein [Methanocaldococcus vulcanius M7]